jgi:hypothetical protein
LSILRIALCWRDWFLSGAGLTCGRAATSKFGDPFQWKSRCKLAGGLAATLRRFRLRWKFPPGPTISDKNESLRVFPHLMFNTGLVAGAYY